MNDYMMTRWNLTVLFEGPCTFFSSLRNSINATFPNASIHRLWAYMFLWHFDYRPFAVAFSIFFITSDPWSPFWLPFTRAHDNETVLYIDYRVFAAFSFRPISAFWPLHCAWLNYLFCSPCIFTHALQYRRIPWGGSFIFAAASSHIVTTFI